MTAASQSWFSRNHFLLRRLHSLFGIVPVGAFLLEHLLTNSLAFKGPRFFNEQVQWIQDLPYLIVLEILFIFAPLAFHAVYGIIIALQGKMNATQYPYMDNWRYTLQRITAWILVVFIAVHMLHFRFGYLVGLPHYADAGTHGGFFALTHAGFMQFLPMWLWVVLYAVGLTAAVFHFCNGIVTFCITWGITVGDQSRKRLSLAATGLAAVLLVWGFLSLYALTAAESNPAPAPATTVAASVGG